MLGWPVERKKLQQKIRWESSEILAFEQGEFAEKSRKSALL
jgi:hypothetical protein